MQAVAEEDETVQRRQGCAGVLTETTGAIPKSGLHQKSDVAASPKLSVARRCQVKALTGASEIILVGGPAPH